MKRLLLLPLLLAASLAPVAVAEAKTAHNVFVSDGFDGDQVQPKGQTLLGPFEIALFELKWKSWGAKQAVATGEWSQRPFEKFSPVRVVLSQKRACPRGSDRRYYMKRTITFTGSVPKGMKRRHVSGFLCWEELHPTPLLSPKPLEPHGLGDDVADVSTGWSHACAVKADGALWCWGGNDFGAIGDGTRKDRWEPVRVRGLQGGVTAVSAGENYTCAVTTAGGAKCWGYNRDGQLGNGTRKRSSVPVDVTGLTSGVQAITTGRDHACALTDAGAVRCWGSNFFGQLGDKSLDSGVVAISAGNLATCALTDAGAVKCWGFLADNAEYGRHPVDIPGLGSGVSAVSVGDSHACALTDTGGVKCWGWNSEGTLGHGDKNSAKPLDVQGLGSGVTSLDAGSFHTCVTTDAGDVKCWGNNLTGELGTTRVEWSVEPLVISGLSNVAELSAGHIFGCVVTATGGVKCWGDNDDGELGVGSGRDR